jgi:hypothetical protein
VNDVNSAHVEAFHLAVLDQSGILFKVPSFTSFDQDFLIVDVAALVSGAILKFRSADRNYVRTLSAYPWDDKL